MNKTENNFTRSSLYQFNQTRIYLNYFFFKCYKKITCFLLFKSDSLK